MNIAVSQVTLRLPENQSLKGKRQVVQSAITRVQNRFHVAAAEVDNIDRWQLGTIGLAIVSNRVDHARETMEAAVNFIVQNYPEVEVLDVAIEVFPFPVD
ncbi:MAG TPA: DUF503 domain-containing protein [Chloroflexi bacterium]|nr:DUF503 domain-containing protein [Chloroflexota bacterium]